MTAITLPQAVQNFVTTTNAHDSDALFAVFAPGTTVVDDGTTYATDADICSWIQVHQVDPKIVITPTSYGAGRLVASVDGEFPGCCTFIRPAARYGRRCSKSCRGRSRRARRW